MADSVDDRVKVVIMRGLPGSGKSSWITERYFRLRTVMPFAPSWEYRPDPNNDDHVQMIDPLDPGRTPKADQPIAYVCSADDYHTVNGKYEYKAENAAYAHADCLQRYLKVVAHAAERPGCEWPTIIVDNTNTNVWELAPYYQAALAFAVDVRIVYVLRDIETCTRRCIHNVPVDRIHFMLQNLLTEKLPGHWKQEIVFAR